MARPSITAAAVKSLREETGYHMMDCKRALEEENGDYDAAKHRLMKPPDDPDESLPEPVE